MGMIRRLVAGAAAGAVATWSMDQVTTIVMDEQSAADAERERAAQPLGRSSVDNLVHLLADQFGVRLDTRTGAVATQLVHYGLGVGPAVAYAGLRDLVPLLGTGRGAAFGLLVWAFNDNLLNTMLGLAGPPSAYPMSTHVRGLAGHLAYGIMTDVMLDVLD